MNILSAQSSSNYCLVELKSIDFIRVYKAPEPCCKRTLITLECRSECANQCNNSSVASKLITQKSLLYVLKRLVLVGGKTSGTSSESITIG